MSLTNYYAIDAQQLIIQPQQASDFAKTVAGDFNPLHDPHNRRFCVPGDLLFTVLLQHYGISQTMQFEFADMVGDGVKLVLDPLPTDQYTLQDAAGKSYLHMQRGGELSRDEVLIERIARSYVAFSGHNFPHILVPLFKQHDVMVNVDRPMVIYQSMAFELQRLDIPNVELRLADSKMQVNGRRGEMNLFFEFMCGDRVIGKGCKRLLLGGLRPYDQTAMDQLVEKYEDARAQHLASMPLT